MVMRLPREVSVFEVPPDGTPLEGTRTKMILKINSVCHFFLLWAIFFNFAPIPRGGHATPEANIYGVNMR